MTISIQYADVNFGKDLKALRFQLEKSSLDWSVLFFAMILVLGAVGGSLLNKEPFNFSR